MKISCQSCQSKYTVSDEKVQGKTVKIKCRKCGATIVVNSSGATTSAAGADDAIATAADEGEAGSYLVNVTEGDQRSMSLQEVVAAYNGGVVTADTYIWADGMGDWQPLGQVDAIVSALNRPADSAPVGAGAAAAEGARAAARRDPGRRAADLFGTPPPHDDVQTSAPLFSAGRSMPMAAGSRSGDENSTLFSLGALTARATPAMPASKSSTNEDSGIIDLRALAAGASQPSAPVASLAPNPFGGGVFPLGAPAPLATPSATAAAPPVAIPSMPPQAGNKTPLFIGVGVAVAAIAIVGAFFAMKGGPAPVVATTPDSAPTASVAPAATTVAAPVPPPSATEAAPVVASAAPSASVAVASSGKGPVKGAAGPGPGRGAGPGKAAAPAAAAVAPPPVATPPAGGGGKHCNCAPGDLMCNMKCSAK